MKHASVLLIALVAGCVNAPANDRADVTADLACETALLAVRLAQEIAPTPHSDRCENCDGTGKLGDGRIVTVCPVCKGTGKRVEK